MDSIASSQIFTMSFAYGLSWKHPPARGWQWTLYSLVEKLKDLCLNQREEIKALKTAILFPDVVNSQLQDILDKQGSELKQAKQVIPTLQRQVTSLTGQLQYLANGLAEVKVDKYSVRGCYEGNLSSPRTPAFDLDATNSL
ncbi:uncharacterized protein LOC113313561 [Papaver somniferum]|uniref:uncharacterized protein LOC113313561 n=1 Tax=Papaver somniferum TaxID=3469 RepID=UPI000E6FE9E9|nr:uncharacterized protein LOC113313561 [Papaver somniferum]XP_026418135.1 uncharacterized protein LOC113313561 [Papaver somniferum]XP_026418136.1 uncharacterized protein LOC113313561 [Papaver somniferum]